MSTKHDELKNRETFSNFLGGAGISKEKVQEVIGASNTSEFKDSSAHSIDDIVQLLKQIDPIYESLDMNKNRVEGIYALGCNCYEQGRIEEAINYYRLCYILDSADEKYLFSLGLSLEKDGQFFEAVTAYTVWNSLTSHSSPLGDFRSAVCYIEMGEHRTAKLLLKSVIDACSNKAELDPVKERAILYLNGLE